MRADTHVGPEQMLHVKGLIHCCSSHVRRSWSFRLATHGRAIHPGTKRTNGTGLTMSVLEGKADFPVAHPDFSV